MILRVIRKTYVIILLWRRECFIKYIEKRGKYSIMNSEIMKNYLVAFIFILL